jgi:release factor glutamine methyltransferase
MTIGNFQKHAGAELQESGIGSANLDVLILLEDALGKDRAWILAHPEAPLQELFLQTLNRQIVQRKKHEPLAYIRGITEFYGREFYVDKHVLEPRPESETMISLLKTLLNNNLQLQRLDGVQGAGEQRTETYIKYGEGAVQQATQQSAKSTSRAAGSTSRQAGAALTVVDVGTGSGALAITAKLEIPKAEVIAIDIDPQCLKVARKNAKKHGIKIRFFEGNLLEPLIASDLQLLSLVILANLPYVPDDFTINQAAAMEPKIAIFGGPDGLDVYRRLFEQLDDSTLRPEYIFTESLPPQHARLAKIAQKAEYILIEAEDFIQVFESKQ